MISRSNYCSLLYRFMQYCACEFKKKKSIEIRCPIMVPHIINHRKKITDGQQQRDMTKGTFRSTQSCEPLTLQQDCLRNCSFVSPAPGAAKPMETWSCGDAERMSVTHPCGNTGHLSRGCWWKPQRDIKAQRHQADVSWMHSPTFVTLLTLLLNRWWRDRAARELLATSGDTITQINRLTATT